MRYMLLIGSDDKTLPLLQHHGAREDLPLDTSPQLEDQPPRPGPIR